MKVYLHIGMFKTGTTALQYFLHENYQLLLEHDIIYPRTDALYDLRKAQHAIFHKYLPVGSIFDKITEPYNSKVEDLKCYVRDSPQKTLLLSCELCILIQDIERLKNDLHSIGIYDIKIIIYLRRQDEWLESCYNQRVKGEYVYEVHNIWHFEKMAHTNWDTLLEAWEKAFGRENLIVRVYEKKRLPEGVIPDFFEAIDVPFEKFSHVPQTKVNYSIDWGLVEIKRLANMSYYYLSQSFLHEMNAHLQNLSQEKHILSTRQRREVLQKHEQSNAQVAQKYFQREKLFDEHISQQDEFLYRGLSTEKFTFVFLRLLCLKQRKLEKYQQRYKCLKRFFVILAIFFVAQTTCILWLLYKSFSN